MVWATFMHVYMSDWGIADLSAGIHALNHLKSAAMAILMCLH